MGDINEGSSTAAQSAQSPKKTSKSGFFRRLLSGPKIAHKSIKPNSHFVSDTGVSKLKTLRVEDVAIPRADIVCISSEMDLDVMIEEFRDSG